MATFKAAVVKKTIFQGRDDTFANVYTFKTPAGATDAELEAIGDAFVTAEKALHSSLVTFTGLQVWDVGLAPNYMRVSKLLTGTGSAATGTNMYRECAVLFTAPLPRRQGSLRTIRRDLRKWYHTCAVTELDLSGATSDAAPTAGTAEANHLAFLNGSLPHGAVICAPDGDERTAAWTRRPYLEHRQFPRGRKEG